jgi:hypothetical protein
MGKWWLNDDILLSLHMYFLFYFWAFFVAFLKSYDNVNCADLNIDECIMSFSSSFRIFTVGLIEL